MKKILAILIIILTTFNVAIAYSAPRELPPYPVIESEPAVLTDAASGQVLFAENMHEQRYSASITKIMTVLLGLENSSYNDTITMSR
ncbi:MAG: D-alanyl-D-alanine carboxypeptidase, partial [Syntrophomonadaceae bacterium]|nr:D-alanyl-D-alanine carboxypeptidase [Syntrophomonadaceae bacterium]